MRRWSWRVNGGAALAARLVLALSIAAASLGCSDQKADRLYREAAARVDRGDLEVAVERLERIVRDYPDSPAAARARKDVIVYRGLLEAARRYPVRRAADSVIQTSRAIERYHRERKAWPVRLDDLVPAYLPAVPADPWGRRLGYRVKERGGYVLSCLGSDGAQGGTGDASDLVVEDGAFVKGGPEGGS